MMNKTCIDGLGAQDLIRLLQLAPLGEGGWYRFVTKSGVSVAQSALPQGYDGDRETCSLIYYLLQGDEVSRWHRLLSPEIWTWHCGGTLVMALGGQDERPAEEKQIMIGPSLLEGESFQAVVPAGVWQTTRVLRGDFALVSCIVSPAYEDADFYMPEL